VVERNEAALQFLVAYEQLAEAVEPTVADLYDPASSLLLGIAALAIRLLLAIDDVRDVAVRLDRLKPGATAVSRVGAQVLAASDRRLFPSHDDGLQHRAEHGDVIHVGCGHDERQRDATTVDQQMTLAPLFFPDQSGSARPLLAPSAL